jgi:hypothetical protein
MEVVGGEQHGDVMERVHENSWQLVRILLGRSVKIVIEVPSAICGEVG